MRRVLLSSYYIKDRDICLRGGGVEGGGGGAGGAMLGKGVGGEHAL